MGKERSMTSVITMMQVLFKKKIASIGLLEALRKQIWHFQNKCVTIKL